MAFVRIALFPGATEEHYLALARELEGVSVPESRGAFLAGQADDGWQVIQVWDDRAKLEQFNEEWLVPALQRLGDRGFPSPPLVRDFEATEIDFRSR